MLEELRIRGLGVIDDAILPLGGGLTVVTGETGAGKTMVVSGLLLLFGARADATRVRAGTDLAAVDGRLEIPAGSPAAQRARDAGAEFDDGTGLTLRRTVGANGRSRAYVGGAPAPVTVLADLAERLLAVHGQADQVRLTRPGAQLAALDRYAGVDTGPVAAAYRTWRAAAEALDERRSRAGELRRESAALEHGLAEIADADPQPGEDTELTALSARLAAADALRAAAGAAHAALLGDPADPATDDVDITALLGRARRTLDQQAGADPTLDAMGSRLRELAVLTNELGADLAGYVADLDADPAQLDQVEARRAVLAGLIRNYGDPLTPGEPADLRAVAAWAEGARTRLDEIDVSDDALAALAARRDDAGAELVALATEVSARRRSAAVELGVAVSAELSGLAMPNAVCTVEVRPRSAPAGSVHIDLAGVPRGVGPDGVDEVEIVLRPYPDAPALPIGKGASGGELSRIMLALEVSLAGTDPVPTMVFDEVDAGVGGRAAVEVGRRLARLATRHQVLVVTHLAQVAAFADRHVVVDRHDSGAKGVTASDVRVLDGADRVAELARMLGGSASDTAREHAAELLRTAAADRSGPARTPAPAKLKKPRTARKTRA